MKFKDIVEELGTIQVHTYIPTKKEVIASKAQKKKDPLEKAIFYNEEAATSTGDVQGIQKGFEPEEPYKPRKRKKKKIIRRPKFSNTFTKKI